MRILIAGATGTLGEPLVRELLARGHEVTGLTRTHERADRLGRQGAAALVCDLLDADALSSAVAEAGPDAIVHAATSIPRRGPTRPGHLAQTNLLRDRGTRNLIAAARQAGVDRLLAESMIQIYGMRDVRAPVGEDASPANGLERRQQEIVDALVSLERQVLGLAGGVVLRYGLFHGPAAPSSQYMLRMATRRMLPIIGRGEGILSWIDVTDAARATAEALESAPGGTIYNVVDDEPVTYADYVRELTRAAGAKSPRRIPLWLGKLIVPQLAEGAARGELAVSNEKIKHELGWRPLRPTYREAHAALVQETRRQDSPQTVAGV